RLDELLRAREAVAAMYTERLRGIVGIEPLPRPRLAMRISWFLYIVRVAEGIDRDALMATLAARGIPTRPYFWPIHLQPPYQKRFAFHPGAYPHTETAGHDLLALPFHGNLTEGEIDHVCESIAEVVARRETSQGR